jgi:hypothetical protein
MPQVAKVSCSDGHVVALLTDFQGRAWGSNSSSEIVIPAEVKTPNSVSAVAAGSGFSAYLLKDGRLVIEGLQRV